MKKSIKKNNGSFLLGVAPDEEKSSQKNGVRINKFFSKNRKEKRNIYSFKSDFCPKDNL